MARQVSLRGKRRSALEKPSSQRTRSIRSAASPRSSTLKLGLSPRLALWRRMRRLAIEWKVPDHGRRTGVANSPTMRLARRVISSAARREKVKSRMRCGFAPPRMRCATRCASVLVLPVPAPARISSAPSPWQAAARCAAFSFLYLSATSTGGLYCICVQLPNSDPGVAINETAGIATLDRNCGLLRFAFPHERPGTTASASAGAAPRHAPRHREGEPARATRRHARADAASAGARLRAHPPAHHDRFFRVAARAHHRRARERRGLPRGAHAHPRGRLQGDRRGDPVVREHAVQPAGGSPDPDRPLRHLERRTRENGLSPGARTPLWAAHAGDLRHPLQLLAARRGRRAVLRADPQFPPQLVAAPLPLRRLARGVLELRRRPPARAHRARTRHALRAACDVAAHGAPRLPKRRAGLALRELQQPARLHRVALRSTDSSLSAVRENRAWRGRR